MEDFERLCRTEYPRLVGALVLYLGDAGAGEDVAQEALARALAQWDRVASMRDPAAWVRRVAFNLARSRWRRRYAEWRANGRHGLPREGHEEPSPAVSVVVRDAVGALPRRQREVVVARFYLDLGYAQTAALLGTSVSSVKGLQRRAGIALREVLADDDDRAPVPAQPPEVPDAR